MIMFEGDWAKYPEAIVHSNTTNRSWVYMALFYRDVVKVKNHLFHLALLNPSLRDLDPYDEENLTLEQKLAIKQECQRNPWYFYREIVRIPAKSGLGSSPLRVDRGTIATFFCYHNHIDTTNIQLRQTGKTIKMEAVLIWLLTAGTFNSTVLFGTTDAKKQSDTVRAVKEKMNLLPNYIYEPIKGKDKDNQQEVTNVARKNYVTFAIGQQSPKAANLYGRGFSIANRLIDEIAETFNSHITIAASSASSNAVVEEARAKNQPYGTIYSCTAGTLDRPEGKFYYDLSNSGMRWNESLLDCKDEQDLRETVGSNSRDRLAPLVDITMSWRQLGISRERFDEIVALSKRDAAGDMDRVKRECYSVWSRGGIVNPLTKNQIETIVNSECEPVRIEKGLDKVQIRWYVDEKTLFNLCNMGVVGIGVDTSQGINRDACSVTIYNMMDAQVLGRSDISLINLKRYAEFIIRLLLALPKSLMVIENKSSGQAIIDAAIIALHAQGEDPFTRIYNRIYQDTTKYNREYSEVQNTPMRSRTYEWYDKYSGLFGFNTNSQLRQQLYDQVLTEAVKMGGSFMYDNLLIKQLTSLEERKGRIDHGTKGHDDAVISLLLIVWFALYGINQRYYCLNSSLILSRVASSEDGAYNEENLKKKEEIEFLLSILPNVEEDYRRNHNTLYGRAVKDRLIAIYKRLEELDRVARNIDELLQNLREDNKFRN